MSKLTPEIKTALFNELCDRKLNSEENCRQYFSYIERIFDREQTLLIGDPILPDDQLNDLYEIVSNVYSAGSIKQHSRYSVKTTVLAIVNICRDYDSQSEDKFYEFIQRKLFGNSPNAKGWLSYLKIYEVMKKCFGRESSHILFGDQSRKSYYSTIMCHAFAPKSSFFALLDALWFIHNERVDDTYFEEDYADIADAFKDFFYRSQDENAGISVGSRSYAIRSGIRYCALQDRELFIGILKRAFGLLSLYYDNGGEDDENRDSYFVQLFEEWYHKKQATIAVSKREAQTKREPTVRDYRTAKIKYAYDSNKQVPYLALPQMRLTGGYSEDRPVLTIKSGNHVLETRDLELGGSEFIRVIRPFNIELTKYVLNNLELSLTISRGSEILYDSNSEFMRNVLIFSGEKEIVGKYIEKGFYTTYFLGDGDEVFHNCSELCKNTYSVQFEVGDDFKIDGQHYHIIDSAAIEQNASKVTVPGLIKKGVCFIHPDYEMPIYSSIEEININQVELRRSLRIEVNGKNYAPDQFSVTVLTTDEHCMIRVWDTFSYDTLFKCLLINGFRFSFDQKYYYGKFDTAKLKYVINEGESEVNFHYSDEKIDIPYLNGILEFAIPNISWVITGVAEQPRFSPNVKPIWYEAIKQNAILKINAPNNCKIEAYNLEGALMQGNEPGAFLLGQAIWGNENKRTTGEDVIHTFINGVKHSLCKVVYCPQITQKPQIEYDADHRRLRIDYSAGYVGPKNARFIFEFDNGNRIAGNRIAFESLECPVTCLLQLEKDIYDFRMYWLKSNTVFGFVGSPKKVLVYKSEFSNGTPEETRFARKTLRISEYVDFYNITRKLATEYFASNIQYYRRADGFDQYSCEIFRNTWKGFVLLGNGYIEIIKNNQCILYFYDEEHKELSEFIFKKENGFICKEQKNTPSSHFIECNYLKYEEND